MASIGTEKQEEDMESKSFSPDELLDSPLPSSPPPESIDASHGGDVAQSSKTEPIDDEDEGSSIRNVDVIPTGGHEETLSRRASQGEVSAPFNGDQLPREREIARSIEQSGLRGTWMPPPSAAPLVALPNTQEDHSEPWHLSNIAAGHQFQLPHRSSPLDTEQRQNGNLTTGQAPDQDIPSNDPENEIDAFSWEDLERRYHRRVGELNEVHDDTMAEFQQLCNFFAVWAEVGSNHEIDRSFKRLKTQMALMQHRESQLEQKRLHYVKVVDAFKSALDMLIE